MAMTITEKILANSAGKDSLKSGENIWLNVDVLMTHDVCGPPTISIWKNEFGKDAKIWDKNKLVIFPDHYIFTANKHANRNVDILREFASEYKVDNYYSPQCDRGIRFDDPELKDSIMWLRYEDLCSQPRSTIDAILRHCDLPEEPFVAASEHYQSNSFIKHIDIQLFKSFCNYCWTYEKNPNNCCCPIRKK